MGQPALLDDPVRADRMIAAVTEGLAAGQSIEAACIRAGVTPTSHYNWCERGRKDEEAGSDTVWVEYLHATRLARAQAEAAALARIKDVEQPTEVREELTEGPEGTTKRTVQVRRYDWRKDAWWLERAFPDRWGQQSTLHVTGPQAKTWDIPGLVLPGVGEAPAQIEAPAKPESEAT